MRFLSLLFLVVFAGAVALFAWQNQEDVKLTFFGWTDMVNLPLVVGAAYALGMLSGWSVVGMLRRSFNNVAEGVERRQQASSW